MEDNYVFLDSTYLKEPSSLLLSLIVTARDIIKEEQLHEYRQPEERSYHDCHWRDVIFVLN